LRNWQVSVGNSPVVLGFDFGGTKIATAVCDLRGNRLASATVCTGAGSGAPAAASEPGAAGSAAAGSASYRSAQAIFGRGIQAARDLLAASAPGSELAAVGAATFGIPFEDRVELAPAIDGWESLALGRELRAAFEGAEVRMATDAKAAATAEVRWGTLNGCDPGVYLNLGTGLAAAIVIGGQVVSGGNGAAGEIGYNLRALSDVGRPLGRRMPLEGVVSGQGLARQASSRGMGSPWAGGSALAGNIPAESAPTGDGPGGSGLAGYGLSGTSHGRPGDGRAGDHAAGQLTAADIFAAAPGDPELDELLTSFVNELAFHLVNLTICINPVRISVGGGMARSWARIRPQLEQALRAGVPYPPELVLAQFPYDAPLLGAVALAVDAAQGRAEPDRAAQDAVPARASPVAGAGHAAGTTVHLSMDTMYQNTMIQDTRV
jgi:glucokinase